MPNHYATNTSRNRKPKWDASKMLHAAFTGEPRLAITGMLKSLAEMTSSYGAVLWRANRTESGASVYLNLLAGWFEADLPLSIGRIPIESPMEPDGRELRVIASEAYRTNSPSWSNDLIADHVLNCTHDFLLENDITRTLAVPVKFNSGRRGAISIYRKRSSNELGPPEAKVLQYAAKHLPLLYHARWTEAAYRVLDKTEKIAHQNKKNRDKHVSESARNKALGDWAKEIKEAFQCEEVSVYLKENQTGDLYTLRITTLGEFAGKIRHSIRCSLDDGFSGLVLYSRQPLRIHDTQNCEEQEEELRRRWPGFEGHHIDSVSGAINQRMALEKHWESSRVTVPHAFLGVPIIKGDNLMGLVRCWFLPSGRQFFSADDETLLQLATDNLAHLIDQWEQDNRNEHEQRAWMEFANRAVKVTGYSRRGGGSADIFINGLRLVDKVLPGDYINTVRLVDEKAKQLYCYAYPTANDQISEAEIDAIANLKNDLEGPNATSLGAAVYHEKQTRVFANIERSEPQGYTPRFRGIKHMIISPILQGKKVVGLLDVRSRHTDPFPGQAQALVDYIAKMMGVQYTQQEVAKDLWTTKKRQAEMDHIQARAYEDIAHQTKGPLTNAERTLQGLLEQSKLISPQILASVHGMVQRALNMSKIVGTIAKLGVGQSLDLATSIEFTPADWVKLANSVYSANLPRLELDPRRLKLRFDAESFWKHAPTVSGVDSEYITQAIYCLVDNAIKYSYPDTKIFISAGTSNTGRFSITVSNEGLPIRPQDISRLKLRGARGEAAKNLTGEGNGIGLWIVDHIMRAHHGELEINATRKKDGITEIRLIFPKHSTSLSK